MKEIFEYSNYREYLIDYYQTKKMERKSFSYQFLADRIGFRSKDFLYRVMKGERNISRSSCFYISKALKHNGVEMDFFENMVSANQAKESDERDHFLSKMDTVLKEMQLTEV